MPSQADLALASLTQGAPTPATQGSPSQADLALRGLTQPQASSYDPSAGGSTLQIYNPFGSNLDTHIPISESVNRFLAGAGKAYTDMGLGARQVAARIEDSLSPQQSGLSDLIAGQKPTRVQALQQEAAEKRAMDARLAATSGGKVGNLVGNVALAAPTAFIPGVNTYTGAALVGAGLGALTPTTSTAEGVGNTAFGAGAGLVGQYGANRLGSLITALKGGAAPSPNLTPGQQAALEYADQLGFQVLPSAKTGSKVMGQIEAKLASQPETSGPFNAIANANQTALNKVAASAIGENANNLSSDVLGNAKARLGSVFDSVADSTPVALDPQVYGPQLKQALADSDGMIGQNGSLADNGLFKRLDDFVNTNGGATREQLRNLSSKLGQAAQNNLTSQGGDRELGNALFNLQDIVEDGIQSSLTPQQAAAYAEARNQYRNLMNLTARTNVINPSSGNVNGRALAAALMSKDKAGFTFGGNDSGLYNAARFVQAFPQMVNDSGTATRIPFSLGQIPSKIAGPVASNSYLMGANLLAGKPLSNGYFGAVQRAANTDPLAQELAKLLANPATRKTLPLATVEAALQGRQLVDSSQQ